MFRIVNFYWNVKLIHALLCDGYWMESVIRKNPTFTVTRDKIKVEYISEGQTSSYELTFGFELGSNPHSKIVSKHIQDSFKESPTMLFMY